VGVELVVETGRVAQQADPPANRRRVDAQVVRQHLHAPAARINSPAETRSRLVLPAPLDPHRHDLSRLHGEVDPGEGGEPTGERN
jgi:hypothetical protein